MHLKRISLGFRKNPRHFNAIKCDCITEHRRASQLLAAGAVVMPHNNKCAEQMIWTGGAEVLRRALVQGADFPW